MVGVWVGRHRLGQWPWEASLRPAFSLSCPAVSYHHISVSSHAVKACCPCKSHFSWPGKSLWGESKFSSGIGRTRKELQIPHWILCEKTSNSQKIQLYTNRGSAGRFFRACVVIFVGGGLDKQTKYIGVWPFLSTQEKHLEKPLVKGSTNQFLGHYNIVKTPRAAFCPLSFLPFPSRKAGSTTVIIHLPLSLWFALVITYHELSLNF